MTVIELPDDEAAVLTARAAAEGMALKDWLKSLAAKPTEGKNGAASGRQLNPEEWSAQFEEWADGFPDAPPIPDEALRRENLYPDR